MIKRLDGATLRRVLDVLDSVYASRDLDGFAASVPGALRRLIPADATLLSEVNPRRGRAAWVVDPPDAPVVRHREAFTRLIHEDPVVSWFARGADGGAVRLSDLITRRAFHRLAVYDEVYRPGRLEHQIAFALATPRPLMLGVTINRARRDFSKADRLGLDLLRPHLIRAYRNAEILTLIQRDLALLVRGVEDLGHALVVVAADGAIRWQSGRARVHLRHYCERPRRGGAHRLPEPLRSWFRQSRQTFPPPLAIERGGRRLVARLLRDPAGALIVLDEQRDGVSAADVASLGLTPRQAEVLSWVAQGKTDPEIAQLLGLSPRTVHHHLERVYATLGVETRTAAALRAVEVARTAPARPGQVGETTA